jgi:hypothetical protein
VEHISKYELMTNAMNCRHSLSVWGSIRLTKNASIRALKRYVTPLSLFLLAISTACAPVARSAQVSDGASDVRREFVVDMDISTADGDSSIGSKLDLLMEGQKLAVSMSNESGSSNPERMTFSIDIDSDYAETDIGYEVLASVASELGIMSELADGGLLLASAATAISEPGIGDGAQALASIASDLGIMSQAADGGLVLVSAANVSNDPDEGVESQAPRAPGINKIQSNSDVTESPEPDQDLEPTTTDSEVEEPETVGSSSTYDSPESFEDETPEVEEPADVVVADPAPGNSGNSNGKSKDSVEFFEYKEDPMDQEWTVEEDIDSTPASSGKGNSKSKGSRK